MEIHFRLNHLDNGQVRVDCRIGPEGSHGLTDGWSHMTTVGTPYEAAEACRDEIVHQSAERAVDVYCDGLIRTSAEVEAMGAGALYDLTGRTPPEV